VVVVVPGGSVSSLATPKNVPADAPVKGWEASGILSFEPSKRTIALPFRILVLYMGRVVEVAVALMAAVD
jgi:hypothetical protein